MPPPGLCMDPLAATPDRAAAPLTIAFFGLGAVGSSMLICLSELADRDDVPLRFVVVVLNDELARDALFHAERLFERIDFIALPDFAPLFDGSAPELQRLAGAHLLVNAAQPGFNTPLLELGLRLDAHVVDLASDMYDAETERKIVRNEIAKVHRSRLERLLGPPGGYDNWR